ncbi:MAG: hypothetical protein H0W02_09540 [Ktedonobacteraceae bacterium]|nr:hypothetical protein [Ktedonobacteraceae bacterium]
MPQLNEQHHSYPMKEIGQPYSRVVIPLVLLLVVAALLIMFVKPQPSSQPSFAPASPSFFASIDTMKVSRDTQRHPLSEQEITQIIQLSASLNTNYITVDTHWDYPAYMKRWIDAIRATGRHVWFRSHPDKWENNNGTVGIMTPEEYKRVERSFILAHPTYFRLNDIFDACPEPEQGHYWFARYGNQWTSQAPNTATKAYNAFLRETSDVADTAFHEKGIHGVITNLRSTNGFFATHPDVLEKETTSKFGYITLDSYPDESTTDPDTAAQAYRDELQSIEDIWHLPIVIGEMGYSNKIEVDDTLQQSVLKAEFATLNSLTYLVGVNYWVGAGTNTSGGYTYIFTRSNNKWSLRPAAAEVSAFYKRKMSAK